MKKIGISLSLAFKSIMRGNRWAALISFTALASAKKPSDGEKKPSEHP